MMNHSIAVSETSVHAPVSRPVCRHCAAKIEGPGVERKGDRFCCKVCADTFENSILKA